MAPIDAARGAAGAHTALGLILMLLTQLLSASPLAVPQLTTSTTSTRRDSITSQAGAFSGRPNQSNNNNNNNPHQQQPQLIRKITNWSEKPPDTLGRPDFGPQLPPTQKHTKDLHIPLKSHFENFIKRNSKKSSSKENIRRRSRNLVAPKNNTENLNVYFEKSFVAINDTTNVSNLASEQSYSNPNIRLHSDTGSAYFNDASILEAKKYNEILQHYKNDKGTSSTNKQRNHEFSHEMYQIVSTTNNQQSQTEFNQKISHDFTFKLGKYSYNCLCLPFCLLCLAKNKINREWQLYGKDYIIIIIIILMDCWINRSCLV